MEDPDFIPQHRRRSKAPSASESGLWYSIRWMASRHFFKNPDHVAAGLPLRLRVEIVATLDRAVVFLSQVRRAVQELVDKSVRKCEACGESFVPVTLTRAWCSAKCSKRAVRAREREARKLAASTWRAGGGRETPRSCWRRSARPAARPGFERSSRGCATSRSPP